MPRRSNIHPSLLRGSPQDSDINADPSYIGDPDDEEIDEPEDDESDDAPEEPRGRRASRDDDDDDDELAQLRRQNAELAATAAALARRIPPDEPRSADADDDEDDTDWEHLIFSDPKAAAKKIQADAVTKAKKELRQEYQVDQGTNKFWSDFYKANPDLDEDDDLVQLVLSGNMKKLGDMPVKKAMAELADLTRERILRYSGKQGQKRKKPMAEGASSPSNPRGSKSQDDAPKGPRRLSDVIRMRKEKRRAASAA